jgi:hypothetical protein
MKSTKQHYEEWKHVLPFFTEEQKRKLYFMMNDYARDYHESEVKKLTMDKKLHISDVRERLRLGKFTINRPEEWDLGNVKLEIQDYDYDSTKISIDELKILHKYIGEILNVL